MLEDSETVWYREHVWEKIVVTYIYIYRVSASALMMCNYLEQGDHFYNISGVLKIHHILGLVACGSLCHPHQRQGC